MNIDLNSLSAAISMLFTRILEEPMSESLLYWPGVVRHAIKNNHVYVFEQELYRTLRRTVFTNNGASIEVAGLPSDTAIFVEIGKGGNVTSLVVATDYHNDIHCDAITILNREACWPIPSTVESTSDCAYARNVVALHDLLRTSHTINLSVPAPYALTTH